MVFKQLSKITGLFFLLALGPAGCATTPGGSAWDQVTVSPGVSIEALLRTAASAGNQMNYSIKQGGGRLVMEKQLPAGAGHFGGNLANHRNRITVSAEPGAPGGSPEVRVDGEYLGDPRDRDVYNCLDCDVNKIKKAIREAR
jgi:hypothetical protein